MRFYAPEECTGKGGYPPEWHQTVKHAVRAEAGHRCVRCQHPYEKGAGEWSPCDERCNHGGPIQVLTSLGEWMDLGDVDSTYDDSRGWAKRRARWRILTVHHLDGVKGNCRWWNLVALCQRCHLQIQGKVQMERVYAWEHSAWFKPYAAGYYAWTYLGQDITRAEAMERLDELLGLELAPALPSTETPS